MFSDRRMKLSGFCAVSVILPTANALIHAYGVSPAQITRMKRNESVSTHTIEMFCKILDCRVEDIMEYIPEKDKP